MFEITVHILQLFLLILAISMGIYGFINHYLLKKQLNKQSIEFKFTDLKCPELRKPDFTMVLTHIKDDLFEFGYRCDKKRPCRKIQSDDKSSTFVFEDIEHPYKDIILKGGSNVMTAGYKIENVDKHKYEINKEDFEKFFQKEKI